MWLHIEIGRTAKDLCLEGKDGCAVFPGWLDFLSNIVHMVVYVDPLFKIHDRYAVVFPGWLEFYDGKDGCGSIDEGKSCWMGWRL